MRKIDPEVLHIIGSMEVEGSAARIYGGLTNGKLDPKLYKRVDEVLKALGGKWNRNHPFAGEKGAHVFSSDPTEAIEQVVSEGGYVDAKREHGEFFTPESLAKRAVDLADIRPVDVCLEPSAGSGNLVVEMLKRDPARVEVIELQEKNRRLLASRNGVRGLQVRYLNLENDFLKVRPPSECGGGPDAGYDRVVMNPPFARRADLEHVTHAVRFLRPGGRLVAIMPASVRWRRDKRGERFEREILDKYKVSMEDNSPDSFRESGTGTPTVTVVLEK